MLSCKKPSFCFFYCENVCLHNPDRCPLHVQSTALSSFSLTRCHCSLSSHRYWVIFFFPPQLLSSVPVHRLLFLFIRRCRFFKSGHSHSDCILPESLNVFLCRVSPAFKTCGSAESASPSDHRNLFAPSSSTAPWFPLGAERGSGAGEGSDGLR